MRLLLPLITLAVTVFVLSTSAADAAAAPATRPAFRNGLGGDDPAYFPIAVWLQSPANAERYKALGVNLYVGLWRGPTAEQLDALERAGVRVICHQNAVGLANRHRKVIAGWMHGDEPDNAQSLGQGKGWGPPIPPEKIVADYQRVRAADPTRPVLLNLGQGVAWDGWHGRGVRTNHPEDYPLYVKGCDIASFDIYPVTHDRTAVAGKLWYVGHGVRRLREWAGPQRPVWACIETTHISNPKVRPTPAQVRSEVWMAIIHGASGIIYFCHEFQPKFIEAGLLAHADVAEAVKAINAEVRELAPVINAPTVADGLAVASSDAEVPIAAHCKRHGSSTYVFAVSMRERPTTGRFTLKGLPAGASEVRVLGEGQRTLRLADGRFEDGFEGYAVHLYEIRH